MTPVEFMRAYERSTNAHRFEEVAPLLADQAVYWFNDGSFQGIDAIKQAFEATWMVIRDEHYTLENVQWLVDEEQVAVCVYLFHWEGIVEGRKIHGAGRGTSVLQKVNTQWKVIHEHLSAIPQ